jgi:Oxidoreductase FAD-binding domain
MVPATDKHYTAAIIERRDFSEDLWLIRVGPGGPFQFKAGQYATLGVDHGDQRIERAYSIVSSPYEEALEFFIELVSQGALTPHLYKLQKGDTMLCRKIPQGRFTLDLKSARTHHLLLATVTGIAPLCAMSGRSIRIGRMGATLCPVTTSSTACRGAAVRGSSGIVRSWSASPPRCLGSYMWRRLAARGKTQPGKARPAASTIWSESTPNSGA